MKRFIQMAVLGAAALGFGLYMAGHLPLAIPARHGDAPGAVAVAAPAVSVAKVETVDFIETVLVTGSLVAREEIMVAPEVEGLRILELKVDEGDRVKKGDVLATLVQDTLDAQIAQSDASLARADAAIAQAKSQIAQSEARLVEAKAAFERAKPLKQSGYLSGSTYDEREAAAKTADAQLVAARDGLKVAEAEKAQVVAQRRELNWRRSKTEVRAPVDGIVSRRAARLGSIAVGAMIAGAGDPMFRIIQNGEVELEAEIVETDLAKIKEGQNTVVTVPGLGEVKGLVRLVAPEVDKTTRLGRVKIFLGDKPGLRVGAFARGLIETAKSRGLAVPTAAVMHGPDGAHVQTVRGDKVETRDVKTGLISGALVEVRDGLVDGMLVVARAGSFLRDGDTIRAVLPSAKVSEAGQ